MSNRSRAIFLLFTIVAVLLVSAVGTTSVYADDGAPPPTETGEVVPPADEGVVTPEPTEAAPSEEPVVTEPTEAAPTEEPVVTEPTEAAPTEAAPVVEEQLPAEADAEPVSILEQVPDDTTVTVLNAEGEAQPLTSQESAEAILTGDPIWCPDGAQPGASSCTPSQPSFDALLDFLSDPVNAAIYLGAGTIYVQQGAYTGGESSIDFNSPDYNLSNINQSNLTITGGWNTIDNTVDSSAAALSQFNIPIVIGTSTNPWGGSLTINNLSISEVYNQTGLTLFSGVDINLSNVHVSESQGGADLNAAGSVTVRSSTFNENKKFGAKVNAGQIVDIAGSDFNKNGSTKSGYDGYGLEIHSLDQVWIDTVNASYNEKFGADINSAGFVIMYNSAFIGNVTYSGSCSHGTKGGYGLKVVTGAAYLEGVTAKENYLFGAHVEAVDAQIVNSKFNKNGSGSLSNPTGYGLEVLSTGGVTLESVEANENQLFGANVQAVNDVFVVSSVFNGNKSYKCACDGSKTYYGYGIQVVTSGEITVFQVTATENNLFGARLKGTEINVVNSVFSDNGSDSSTLTGKGLEIESSAYEVTLSGVTANGNQLFGAKIQAAGFVTVANSFFNGNKHTYSSSCQGSVTTGGYGLQVVTTDGISVSMVQATDNYLYGALLNASGEDGVTVGNSSFDRNKSGLEIKSTGPVSLLNVTASDNKLFGADIEAKGTEANVAIKNSFFNGNQSYTSSSCKGKTYNGYGLRVVTTGSIALTDVTAERNYVFGAYLEGTNVRIAGTPKAEAPYTTSSFSNNGTGVLSDHIGKGLEIKSTGSDSQVSLSYVTANENQLFGANIQADGLVLIDNSVFSGNKSYTSTCYCKTYDGYGLQVITTSDIELDTVTANGNYLFGAHLKGANVTVSDSMFNENSSPEDKNPTGRGLEVISTGNTLLQHVEASDNQLFGANVQAGGKVEVTSDSIFSRNIYYTYSSCKGTKSAGYGLKVVTTDPTLGTISLTGVTANDNGAEGTILQGPTTVDVVGSTFNNNGASGLSITASGNVTLTNVIASGNKGNGVDVKGVCTNVVKVDGGTFTQNSKYGIKIVDATYTPIGTQTFDSNGSGNVFQDSSTCVSNDNSADDSNDNGNGSGDSDNGNGGWNGWYWWWYAHRGHHHH